jgi:hypothetical protein
MVTCERLLPALGAVLALSRIVDSQYQLIFREASQTFLTLIRNGTMGRYSWIQLGMLVRPSTYPFSRVCGV